MANPILDGHTIDGDFPGSGWDRPFAFKFRPALHAEVTEYRESIKNQAPKVVSKKQVEFIKAHLTTWDRVDHVGNALPIGDEMSWETLSDAAISYLWSDVAGYGSDKWKESAKN